MTKTLILAFHRDLTKSKANAALLKAAEAVEGVEIVDVQARYPDGLIDWTRDTPAEAARLLAADRLVFQFPIQWYSVPPLMKTWLDAVLTVMYYIKAEELGDRLVGTPLMIAATAGNVPTAYARDGGNHYTIDEIMTPLKATAHRCGLPWHEPYVVFEADRLDAAQLDTAGAAYVRKLEDFVAATPAPIEGVAA
ncbi:NAD(P)H-dependent oxidoreductase [Sulfitobacter pontiacus]|uniref:NAD(P)H-dependent oxidoreductase n=1 Tax=Sulfitobacter pontiacus TaxID=60137 RepID=UPI002779DA45|nr:NAD(P)H-dependent oxidoreductase [Sulfitobacter pontiacus]GLO79880.1 NAD(P)H dehydrogenase [Sulfitobacter pontiacus]